WDAWRLVTPGAHPVGRVLGTPNPRFHLTSGALPTVFRGTFRGYLHHPALSSIFCDFFSVAKLDRSGNAGAWETALEQPGRYRLDRTFEEYRVHPRVRQGRATEFFLSASARRNNIAASRASAASRSRPSAANALALISYGCAAFARKRSDRSAISIAARK